MPLVAPTRFVEEVLVSSQCVLINMWNERDIAPCCVLMKKKKYGSRIIVANPDAGNLQGNRVDGFAEVIRLSEKEWTRCDVRLKMFVAQDFFNW